MLARQITVRKEGKVMSNNDDGGDMVGKVITIMVVCLFAILVYLVVTNWEALFK